jgi:trimeric autotransporter adhesin
MLRDKEKKIIITIFLLSISGIVLSQTSKPSDDSNLTPLNISSVDQTKEGSLEIDIVSPLFLQTDKSLIVGYGTPSENFEGLAIFHNDIEKRLILDINSEEDAEEGDVLTSLNGDGLSEWKEPKEIMDEVGIYMGTDIWKKSNDNKLSLGPDIRSLRIGTDLISTGNRSVAIGRNVKATGTGSTAVGTKATGSASGDYSLLISSSPNSNQKATGKYSSVITSIDKPSSATHDYSLVLGHGISSGESSVTLMGGGEGRADHSVAIFGGSFSSLQDNPYSFAIGGLVEGIASVVITNKKTSDLKVEGDYSTLISSSNNSAIIKGLKNTAILNADASVNSSYASLIGSGTIDGGLSSTVIMGGEIDESNYSTALGKGSYIKGRGSVSLNMSNQQFKVFGDNQLVMSTTGLAGSTYGDDSTLILTGDGFIESGGQYNVVIGSGSTGENTKGNLVIKGTAQSGLNRGNYSVAIGPNADARSDNSLAIKNTSGNLRVEGLYSTGIGVGSENFVLPGEANTAIMIGKGLVDLQSSHSTIISAGTIGSVSYGTAIMGGKVTGEGSTAVGGGSLAQGDYSTSISVIGSNNIISSGDYSTIINNQSDDSEISGLASTAILNSSGTIYSGADYSAILGLGGEVNTNSIASVAMMGGEVSDSYSLAIGENSLAEGIASSAIGKSSGITAGGDYATIIGTHSIGSSNALGDYSVAILNAEGTASGESSVVIGSGVASKKASVVIGGGKASGDYSLTIQSLLTDVGSSGERAISIKGKESSGVGSVAVLNAISKGRFSVGLGAQALATGAYSIAIGAGNGQEKVKATGKYSTAIGTCSSGTATASGEGSTVVDPGICSTTASGGYSTAFSGSVASGNYSTALLYSQASGEASVALNGSTASGKRSVALLNASAIGKHAIAMKGGTATGEYSMAIGYGISNEMDNSFLTYGLRVEDGKVTISYDNSYDEDVDDALHVIGKMKAESCRLWNEEEGFIPLSTISADNRNEYVTGSGQLSGGIAFLDIPVGMNNPLVRVYSLDESKPLIASVVGSRIEVREASSSVGNPNPSASFNYIIQEELD